MRLRPSVRSTRPRPPPSCLDDPGGPGTCSRTGPVRTHSTRFSLSSGSPEAPPSCNCPTFRTDGKLKVWVYGVAVGAFVLFVFIASMMYLAW